MRLRQPVPVYNKAKNGFILCFIFIIFIIIVILYFMFYFFKVCMETDISTTPSFGKIFFPFFLTKILKCLVFTRHFVFVIRTVFHNLD